MMYQDPINALRILNNESHVFLLDSKIDGRYSYLGFAPVDVIEVKSFDQLRQKKIKFPAVGCIAYDGSMCFGIYDTIVRFDHLKKRVVVQAYGRQQKAKKIEEYFAHHLQQPLNTITPERMHFTLKPTMTKKQYIQAVIRALQHIHDGNIYQINLSYQHSAALAKPLNFHQALHVYEQLRRISPTHLCAFMRISDDYVLSSSPERFCSLVKSKAVLMPMKGTRPRGKTKTKDAVHYRDLYQSKKEKAELLMVTDLARNDLGRVCKPGSVKVKTLRTIERYAHVFQATSTVEGQMQKGKDIVDLLETAFPGGSVTGCPKMSAMNIIRQLELSPRGLYTGALGYFGINHQADFSMLIRSIFITHQSLQFHVGSGIVADSNPSAEYKETQLKSQSMIEALIKGLKK